MNIKSNIIEFKFIAPAMVLIYLFVAMFTHAITGDKTHITSAWLASGAMFGVFMVAPRNCWAAILAGTWAASMAWALTERGLSSVEAVVFSLIDPLSVLAGVTVAAGIARGHRNTLRETGGLIAGSTITGLLGATLTVQLGHWLSPAFQHNDGGRAWACSSVVGVLIVAPVLLGFNDFRVKRSGGMSMRQFRTGAVLFSTFIAVTWIVFSGDTLRRFGAFAAASAYLPPPLLLLTAFQWGSSGGAFTTLVGALVVIGLTTSGGGPFHISLEIGDAALIEAMIYVSVWTIVTLLMQGIVNERFATLIDEKSCQFRYQQIMEAASIASVEFDVATGEAIWSDNATSVLGSDKVMQASFSNWTEWIDPIDKLRAEKSLITVRQGLQCKVTEILHPRNAFYPTIEVTFAAVHGPDGAVEKVAGLFRTAQIA
ncbi:MASE1 domain-containing protein [Burkholderia sp. RS02]|uniref:MASE1 domain-containing protein n=1 Tax=unclassified Burkholderia TaxID=2613784 RepID=UPI003218C783